MPTPTSRWPAPPGPEPNVAGFVVGDAALKDLAGRDLTSQYVDAYLPNAWDALWQAFADMEAFFAPAHRDRYWVDDARLKDLMCVYGRFLPVDTKLLPGDLVSTSRGEPLGDPWYVALGGGVLGPDDADERYEEQPLKGRPSAVWRATKARAVDPASPAGRFWGPNLSLYRWALRWTGTDTCFSGDFLEVAFGDTPYPLSSYEDLVGALAPELVPLSESPPLHAGQIVFAVERERVGLVLSDVGLCTEAPDDDTFEYVHVSKSRCDHVWWPHPGEAA